MSLKEDVNDPHHYLAEVAPKLGQFTITRIARATGMSTSSASKIRSGKQLPHPRHWKALAELSASGGPPASTRSSYCEPIHELRQNAESRYVKHGWTLANR
jgi:hypothetical protein